MRKSILTISFCLALLMKAQSQAAVCSTPDEVNTKMKATTPSSRFEVVKDQSDPPRSIGVVRDLATGLMWTQCPLGYNHLGFFGCEAVTGVQNSFDWEEALKEAEKTVLNYSGWRLPNVKELMSIVERSCVNPAINSEVFTLDTPIGGYWTNTPADNAGNIWTVDFTAGAGNPIRYDDTGKAYLRLVRDDDTP